MSDGEIDMGKDDGFDEDEDQIDYDEEEDQDDEELDSQIAVEEGADIGEN